MDCNYKKIHHCLIAIYYAVQDNNVIQTPTTVLKFPLTSNYRNFVVIKQTILHGNITDLIL